MLLFCCSKFKSFSLWLMLISLICLLASCQPTESQQDDIFRIDFDSVYRSGESQFPLSKLIHSVEYVKLETSDDCPIARTTGIAVSDNYIVMYDIKTKRVLLFSRDGKYLHDIGSRGQGPEEYNYVEGKTLAIVNNEQQVVFTGYSNDTYVYNIDGTFVKHIKTPARRLDGFGYLGNNQIVVHQQMLFLPFKSGRQLLYYDMNLEIRDSLLPRNRDTTWLRDHNFSKDNFDIYNDNIYVRQGLQDTIFKIDLDKQVTPEVVFDFGRFRMPDLLVQEKEYNLKYMNLMEMHFTEEFIYFVPVGRCPNPRETSFCFQYFLYNRKTHDSFMLGAHPEPFFGEDETSELPLNDVDGLNSPEIFYYNNNGVSADLIEVLAAKEFYSSELFDKEVLSNDESYNEVMALLDQSDIEDNPIVRIVYLK